ncbi:MFS transporter [Collimonas sp. NPDC087041]|uniref:MFS transporter n=1 Tax=Collimonas sp. NPDC087041 TaxID=3363960 RepID=UPI003818971F
MTNSTSETDRSRLLILASVCLAAVVLPLSFSGGAVATPAIGRDLGGSPAALTWITNAFMLSFGSLLMAAGALADEFGRKRLFILGMALFIVVSLALSFAPTVAWLDVLRAIQGVAAAASLSSGSAALAQEFEGHARTRAFSLLGTSFGVGLAFGPLLAGALIDVFGWRSIFMTTAGIAALALVFGAPRMRETRNPNAAGLDWPGTLTFTGTLALFTFGVIQAPESGWTSPFVVALLAASLIFLAAFIWVETRVARPMLDLSLFRYPRFVGVQMLPIGTCYCYIVLVVLLPLRFIGMGGLSEIDAGWLMLALSAPMLVIPLAVATLVRWISAGVLSGIGFLIAAIGLYWLSNIGVGEPGHAVVIPMFLIGVGASMPWGLMDGLSVSVVPKERAGMATGIFNTTRVAGEGIALAIAVAMLSAFAQSGLQSALSKNGPIAIARINEAAQRVAAGDLLHASASLPEVSPDILISSYAGAFQSLLHTLIAITVLSAIAAFLFLSRTPLTGSDSEDSPSLVDATVTPEYAET